MHKLRYTGQPSGFPQRMLARLTFNPAPQDEREDCFLGIQRNANPLHKDDLVGHAGLLVEQGAEKNLPLGVNIPILSNIEGLGVINEGTIVAVNGNSGTIFLMFRPESPHNAIFATGSCNSNCIMCSQPPDNKGGDDIVSEHLRLIDLIQEPPETFGISGGEPTLLKNGLISILKRLKEKFPNTHIQMLTNGRMYSYEDFVFQISNIDNQHFISAIPLYSNIASKHDYVVQVHGAFDQTIRGLYNAAKHGLQLEIRIVLHKQTIQGLLQLAEFICRNLPFVGHVALMGLENMGYVKKNWEELWIDPLEYATLLEEAVTRFHYHRVRVSIYNLQLCLLPKSLWFFARQSISDYKNIYLDECGMCAANNICAGLFASSEKRHSNGIHALAAKDLVGFLSEDNSIGQ